MSYEDDALRDLLEKAKQSVSKNGHTTSSSKSPDPDPPPIDQVPAIDYGRWKIEAGYLIKRALDDVPENDRPMIASMPAERLADLIVKQAREIISEKKPPFFPLPPELSETDIDDELNALANRAIVVFRDVYLPQPIEEPASTVIVAEDAREATTFPALHRQIAGQDDLRDGEGSVRESHLARSAVPHSGRRRWSGGRAAERPVAS